MLPPKEKAGHVAVPGLQEADNKDGNYFLWFTTCTAGRPPR